MDERTEKKGEKRETDSGDILLNLSLQILDAVVKVIFELTVRDGERCHFATHFYYEWREKGMGEPKSRMTKYLAHLCIAQDIFGGQKNIPIQYS